MFIYRDNKILDLDFPFEINQIILKKTDNCKDFFHWHDFCEITYIKKGKGNYFVNGKQYDMNKGDLIIFNNVEPHGWLVQSENMNLMVMIFSMDLVSDLDSDYLQPFIERGSNFKNKIDSEDLFVSEIAMMMDEIYEEYYQNTQGYELLIMADILRILTFLIRYYQNDNDRIRGKNVESLKDKKKAMKRLEKAFDYINHHYTEKITLREVAKSVYMSKNYFSAYFKKVANISFIDYVTKLRLKKANELIKMTDMSMLEIAMKSGFNNMSNFYRLYKKHIGQLSERK